MLAEKLIGLGYWVPAKLLFIQGVGLAARSQRIGNLSFCVPRFNDVAGQQSSQFALSIHDWKRAESKSLAFDQVQHVSDQLIRRYFDRLLDQAVDIIFHAADFRKLLLL